jgi:hypothetical protein
MIPPLVRIGLAGGGSRIRTIGRRKTVTSARSIIATCIRRARPDAGATNGGAATAAASVRTPGVPAARIAARPPFAASAQIARCARTVAPDVHSYLRIRFPPPASLRTLGPKRRMLAGLRHRRQYTGSSSRGPAFTRRRAPTLGVNPLLAGGEALDAGEPAVSGPVGRRRRIGRPAIRTHGSSSAACDSGKYEMGIGALPLRQRCR